MFPFSNMMKSSKNVAEIEPHSVKSREDGRTRGKFATKHMGFSGGCSGSGEAVWQQDRDLYEVPCLPSW